jgi:hypothetical protein
MSSLICMVICCHPSVTAVVASATFTILQLEIGRSIMLGLGFYLSVLACTYQSTSLWCSPEFQWWSSFHSDYNCILPSATTKNYSIPIKKTHFLHDLNMYRHFLLVGHWSLACITLVYCGLVQTLWVVCSGACMWTLVKHWDFLKLWLQMFGFTYFQSSVELRVLEAVSLVLMTNISSPCPGVYSWALASDVKVKKC